MGKIKAFFPVRNFCPLIIPAGYPVIAGVYWIWTRYY